MIAGIDTGDSDDITALSFHLLVPFSVDALSVTDWSLR
jgi:hypothetical protein